MIKVGFKKLDENAIIPNKNYPTDSGFDLFANEDVTIEPGETKVIKTGIAVQLPPCYEAQVRPRSGVTSKTKLRVQLGTIDNSYIGEIGIIVDNIHWRDDDYGINERIHYVDGSSEPTEKIGGFEWTPSGKKYNRRKMLMSTYLIQKGDKLAQLVIQKLPIVDDCEIDSLQETSRGTNGFGSSGY